MSGLRKDKGFRVRFSAVLSRVFVLLNLALCLGLISARFFPTQSNESHPPIPSVSIQQASKHLVASDAIFVDARPFSAYKAGFIPTAITLPQSETPSPETLSALRTASKIIVYCDGSECGAAGDVAEALVRMKFQNVLVMTDGMKGWESAGMPVSKYPDS